MPWRNGNLNFMSVHPREALATYLRESNLGTGDRLPPERELAAALGLSSAAVNRAVIYHIGCGLLRRAGHKLLFAGDDATAPTRTYHAFFPEQKLQSEATEMAALLGCTIHTPESREENHLRKVLLELDPARVDGVLMGYARCPDILRSLAEAGVHVVVAGEQSTEHHCVSPDFAKISFLAVKHLAELGHQRIAFAALPHAVGRQQEEAGFREACFHFRIEESISQHFLLPSDSRLEVERVWTQMAVKKNAVTGIVCQNSRIARHLVNLARKAKLCVPRDLSLVSLQDRAAATMEPPLTAVVQNASLVARTGILLLHDLAAHHENYSRHRCHEIIVAPILRIRQSSVVAPGKNIVVNSGCESDPRAERSWPQASLWSNIAKKRGEQVDALNNKLFPTHRGGLAEFVPLDLSGKANRSISTQNAWLGDEPLRFLSPGEVCFHGVPFHILDQRANDGYSAIVLRSSRAHTSERKPLPLQVSIPLHGRKADAIYILHAAGWAGSHEAFGSYKLDYVGGRSESIPILPYAHEPPKEADAREWCEEAIIQDWHPVFPRFESSHVLPCLVTQEGDPLLYERYLYAWQWVNPHPGRPLRALHLRTTRPEGRATLAVLAVTLQRKSVSS